MRLVTFLLLLLMGCSNSKNDLFEKGTSLGTVSKKLEEASGLAASVRNPGYFWTVNDSGNPPEVFLIDVNANIKLTCRLANAANRDWEEIRVSTEEGTTYLYVADIGDNEAKYDLKFIYRFEEPLLAEEKELIVTDMDTLVIELPDGKRDAEAILIDPLTHDFFLFSKREDSINVYRQSYPLLKDTLLPEKILRMPLHNIASADISVDGKEVLLKNYDNIYYWRRTENETIGELLKRKPIELSYQPEKQGEAITWALDGTGFYTLSESPEKEWAQLKFYKRK